MSEKEKSGEDLIEKVEQETAQESTAFDAKAFAETETKVET